MAKLLTVVVIFFSLLLAVSAAAGVMVNGTVYLEGYVAASPTSHTPARSTRQESARGFMR